ncbi:MAG TPA: hypothetical protein VF644_02660 [Pyrinomonadaceae bacterium]|jgi:hypothetical protein
MDSNLDYRVLPRPHRHQIAKLSDNEKQAVINRTQGLNNNSLSAIVVISAVLLLYVAFDFGFGLSLFGLLIVVLGTAGVNYNLKNENISKNISDLEKARTEKANQERMKRDAGEAEYLTSNLLNNYNSSINLTKEVSKCLKQASIWLNKAEKEFNSNAFSPFWDAIEKAAIWLGNYNQKLKRISQNADDYYQKLNGEKHNFPDFPVKPKDLPDPSFVINEMRRITRLGQTNFQFANIWEHRRTRTAIVDGFRTLNEAVNNLGGTIENSISNLQSSISSDMARAVQEQIRTRGSIENVQRSVEISRESNEKLSASIDKRLLEQNRMLDNIQHDRKPRLKDTPSKH